MFSVIVPTVRSDLLPRALRSVAAQTLAPLEVLVLHDGGSPLPIGDWPFPVRALGVQPRQGPSGARNAAIALAEGEQIAFLDDDDEWLPDHLQQVAEASRQGFAFTDALLMHEGEGWAAPFRFRFGPDTLLRTNPIILSTVALSKQAFWRVGGFDLRLARYEAWDLFLRLRDAGTSMVRVPEVSVHYHYSPRSVTADDGAMARAFAQFRTKHSLGDLPRASFASMLRDPRFAADRDEG